MENCNSPSIASSGANFCAILVASITFSTNGALAEPLVEKLIKAIRGSISNLPQNLQVLDPETYPKEEFDKLVAAFVERRKGKNTQIPDLPIMDSDVVT